jgi:hypothetical protein
MVDFRGIERVRVRAKDRGGVRVRVRGGGNEPCSEQCEDRPKRA